MKNPMSMSFHWKPDLRSAVQIGGEMVPIPFGFWNLVEVGDISRKGILKRHHEVRLWRMLGRKGRCPHPLRIALNREDFDRVLTEIERKLKER